MHNRSRRDIAGKSYETRSSEILADFGWQTSDKRMKTKKVAFVYIIRNNNHNEPMTDMFKLSNSQACIHNLRINATNFQILKPRATKKSIKFSDLKL